VPSERATVFHSLAALLDAGVPLSSALPTALVGLSGATAGAFRALGEQVEAGATVSEAVEATGRGFTRLDRALIRAGEAGGRLPEALRTLAQWHAFEWGLGRKMLSGLVLPVLIIHVAAVVWPFAQFLINESGLGTFVLGVLGNLAGWYLGAALVWLVLHHEGIQGALGRVVVVLPLLGKAVRHLDLSRYCRAFQSLHEAGLGAVETAQFATDVCSNQAVAAQLRGGIASARDGKPISEGFAPSLGDFVSSWQSGELSGNLDEATARLASHHAERAEELFTQLAQWVPRLIYGFVMIQLARLILSAGSIAPGGGL